MMYYDRTISDDLLNTAKPGGPLEWLVPWVSNDSETRLDFRREDSKRMHGGLQVYVGRTSPVEFLGRTRKRVRLWAGKEYRAITPTIFDTYRESELGSLRSAIEDHIAACRARMQTAFTDGEAVPHNGLMRRYGLNFQPGDCLLAIDSEIVFGFRKDTKYPSGTPHKKAYNKEALQVPDLPAGISPLRKLDALGLLSNGAVGIIEVKGLNGDLAEAARQTAAHVYNFRQLMREPGYDLSHVINGMIDQKIDLGLMANSGVRAVGQPRLLPVIAAPDHHKGWIARWIAVVGPLVNATPLLRGLRFWRLSEHGEVLEEHIV